MAFIGLKLPHETARLLHGLEVEGEPVGTDTMHVTVLYLGKGVTTRQITKAITAAEKIISNTPPFLLKTNKVTCFPKGEDGVPIIAKINSPELIEFHSSLKLAFDKAGVDYSNRFPDYKPHVTLAYNDKVIEDIRFEDTLQWAAHEVTLWGGDNGDDRMSVTFPLTLKAKEAKSSCIKTRKISSSK
jgi:2'-5' RNA ligase